MIEYRKDCYFYYESQEMSAYVPNCTYDEKYRYGFCPCNNCKNYITKKEAYELIKKIVRCKNCKHALPKGFCHKYSRKVADDWFCADGTRKIGEDE